MTDLIVHAQQIDEVLAQYSNSLTTSGAGFACALSLANAITEMRKLLTAEIMNEIIKLQNTQLGFRTDRPNDKKPSPYTTSELIDPIIECALRGFYVVGNEFNIIAGGFYAAKNGLRRKVLTFPGLSNYKDKFSIPRLIADKDGTDKGAIIEASASWKMGDIKQSLEREFAIKMNVRMTADALQGKAQRKMYAAVFDLLTGVVTPEGDVDDAPASKELVIRKPHFAGREPDKSVDPQKAFVDVVAEAPKQPAAEKRDTSKLIEDFKSRMSAERASELARKLAQNRSKDIVAETQPAGEAVNQEAAKEGPALTLEPETQRELSVLERIKARLSEYPNLGHDDVLYVLKRNGLAEAHMEHVEDVRDEQLKLILEDWGTFIQQAQERPRN